MILIPIKITPPNHLTTIKKNHLKLLTHVPLSKQFHFTIKPLQLHLLNTTFDSIVSHFEILQNLIHHSTSSSIPSVFQFYPCFADSPNHTVESTPELPTLSFIFVLFIYTCFHNTPPFLSVIIPDLFSLLPKVIVFSPLTVSY